MQLNVMTPSGSSTQSIQVSETAFGRDYNEALVHQVVIATMAGQRQGTKRQKNRHEVSGSTKKPWNQKGSGRARAGNIRSPIWRGGGVTFAARPRNFEQKVNKKMYTGAMRCILSELIRQGRLTLIEDMIVKQPKTKELVAKLKDMGMSSVFIITEKMDDSLYLASRNLPNVLVREVDYVDPVKLLKFEHVLATVGALKKLEEALK